MNKIKIHNLSLKKHKTVTNFIKSYVYKSFFLNFYLKL